MQLLPNYPKILKYIFILKNESPIIFIPRIKMWKTVKSCIYKSGNIASNKIAAFDMDSTLILSNIGAKYPTEVNDYIWCFPNTVQKIQELSSQGFTIVIFSNRRGSPQMNRDVQKRLDKMITQFNVPTWVFLATKDDNYRKPNTGMMQLFSSLIGFSVYDPQSFYCGDAAGPKSDFRWNRWSDVDSEFAKNIGLPFIEPQNLFQRWQQPIIPENINVLITCGQDGSGWEEYKIGLGSLTPLQDGRELVVVDDDMVFGRKAIPNVKNPVYLVLGKHPQIENRINVGNKLGPYIVYMYSRPSYDESLYDKNFPKLFQPPISERVTRCN